MRCFQAAQSRRADHIMRQGTALELAVPALEWRHCQASMDDDSMRSTNRSPAAFFGPQILLRRPKSNNRSFAKVTRLSAIDCCI